MVYEFLNKGAENAKSGDAICAALNLQKRQLTQIIERERRAGFPICATSDSKTPGYYIPEDRETMQAYCGRLLHRMREIAKTREACLQSAEALPKREAES